jgi:hypothetical protein
VYCPGRRTRTKCKYRDKLFAYTRELAAVIYKRMKAVMVYENKVCRSVRAVCEAANRVKEFFIFKLSIWNKPIMSIELGLRRIGLFAASQD